jgi:hypothetical protein
MKKEKDKISIYEIFVPSIFISIKCVADSDSCKYLEWLLETESIGDGDLSFMGYVGRFKVVSYSVHKDEYFTLVKEFSIEPIIDI